MKTSRFLLTALSALALAFACSSCVSDDWDDGYGYRDNYRYRDDYRYRDGRHHHDDRYRDDRHRDDDHRHHGRHDRGPHIPKGFVRAGGYSAGGAVEVGIPTGRPISEVLIACTSGSVAVNTIVVREGSAKTPRTVSARVPAGETQIVGLGGRRNATGLRISTGGSGSFDVYVR